jgi:lactate permease
MGTWTQNYDPLGNAWLSTGVSAAPVCLLFYLLAVRKIPAHWAAVYSFLAAFGIAGLVFGMPWTMVGGAATTGVVFGVVRIAWTLIAAVFVYEMTVETGHFETIKGSIGGITDDRRLQVLLVAYAFGALLEGAGGGGAPVAITGAMMVGMGFRPFEAAVLSLVANTAPVAWGGAGNPIRTLHAVTDLPTADLSAMVGRILPWTAVILPFWLIRTQTNWRRTFEVWPGALACGLFFACVQFGWSNFVEESLVDVMGGMLTLLFLAFFYRWWKPAKLYRYPQDPPIHELKKQRHSRSEILRAWSPFILLSAFVVVWGLPAVKSVLVQFDLSIPVPGLNQMVMRTPPVVAETHLEGAFYDLSWLSTAGTAIFLGGLASAPILGLSFGRTMKVMRRTLYRLRYSMVAIVAMLGLGYITRYSGMDAVMGLALTNTGVLYPLFGTLIGWLGVALTGTDAGSNALFGSLQVITANKLGLNPVLMAAANSAGGVMGKMIDAQSIIVACVAVDLVGKEGDVFRAVLIHSILLALIVGVIVTLYAYVFPGVVPGAGNF